jgi:SPP1 gp7 family putative phage head morphogenesis protein
MAQVTTQNLKDEKLLQEVSNEYGINNDFMSLLPKSDVILRKAGVDIDIYLEMMKDPQILSVAQKRRAYIQSYSYKIESEDKTTQAFIEDVFKNIDVTNLIAGLFTGVQCGYAVLELIWEVDSKGKYIIQDIKRRNPLRFSFTTNGKLMYKDPQTMQNIEAPYGKFIIYTHDALDDSNKYGNALNSSCFWYWSFKKKGWGFWLNVMQRYGLPPLIYKALENGLDDEDLDNKASSLGAVQSGASIVIDKEEDIKAVDIKADKESFEKFIQLSDQQIAKVYLGSAGLTEQSKYGTYTNSKTQENGLENIVIADLKGFQNSIKKYIIEPLIKFNFGDDVVIPDFYFVKNEDNETTKEDDENNTQEKTTKEKNNNSSKDEKNRENSSENNNSNIVSDIFINSYGNFNGVLTQEDFNLINEFSSDLSNIPDHTKGLENITTKLYSKIKTLLKNDLKFKKLDDNPKEVLKQLQDYSNDLEEKLSEPISYAIFYAKMLAKYETKKQTENFSLDKVKEVFYKVNVYDTELLDFEEARKLFKSKVTLTSEEFELLKDEAKSQAFRIAGVESRKVASLVNEALQNNFNEKGKWKKEAEGTLNSFGYDITGNHLNTIYRTNIFQSYSVAQWSEYKEVEKSFPALRYSAIIDSRTRPTHSALNGKVFLLSDSIWGTIYPPNGYNCRCTTIPVSKKKLKKIKVEDGTSKKWKDFKVDDGFNHNPATSVREVTPANYGKAVDNTITYNDYDLDSVKSFNYRDTLQNERELKNNVEIEDIKNVSVLLQKGKVRYNLIKDILQSPSEIWIQTANNKNNSKSYLSYYIKSYTDTKNNTTKKYAVIVDKYSQVVEVKELANYKGIRAGALIYYTEEVQ